MKQEEVINVELIAEAEEIEERLKQIEQDNGEFTNSNMIEEEVLAHLVFQRKQIY